MNTINDLLLHEEILLLALHDDKGLISNSGFFTSAMGGAILSELVLRKAVSIRKDKNKNVILLDDTPTGDAVVDECLAKIRDEKKEKKATHWVGKFSGLKDLKNRTARELVVKGVLTEDQDKFLGLFKRTIFPEADHGPEAALRARLHRAIFTETEDLDGRTVVVVALGNAAGMLSGVFGRKELKPRKNRIQQLTDGHVASQATKEAVEAIQMAVILTTIIVPVVITST